MPQVNYLAVILAAVAAFILGALWYSPLLFVKPWMVENRITVEEHKANPPPMGKLLAIAFLCALLTSLAMAVILVPLQHHSLEIGVRRGFVAGVCFVATAFGSSYAFELRSLRHWMINGGFYVVQMTLIGAILGLMNG